MRDKRDLISIIVFVIVLIAAFASFLIWLYYFVKHMSFDETPYSTGPYGSNVVHPKSPYRFGVLFFGPLTCVLCSITAVLRKDATESYKILEQNSSERRKEKNIEASAEKQKTKYGKNRTVKKVVVVSCCLAVAVGFVFFFYNYQLSHPSVVSTRDSYIGKWVSVDQYSNDTLIIHGDGTASYYVGTTETNGTWNIGPNQVMSLTLTSIYSSKTHNVWLENNRLIYEEYSGKNLYFEKETSNSLGEQDGTTKTENASNNSINGSSAAKEIKLPGELSWGDSIETVCQKGKELGGNVERVSDDSTFVEISQITLFDSSANQACYFQDDLGLVEIIYDGVEDSDNVDSYKKLVDRLTNEYGEGVEENNEEKSELCTVWKDGTTTVECKFWNNEYLRVTFDYDRAYD